jgi:hypothetical protein
MSRNLFFQSLFEECTGFVEVRFLPSRKRDFFPSGLYQDDAALGVYIGMHPKDNCYFGVATRDGHGGRKENIVEIPAVWADVDFKTTTADGLRDRLARFPFRPSMAVHSGGGYHLYWILKEPVGQSEICDVEDVNRRIAIALDGDTAAVDAARILRIPGTVNQKRRKPVTLKHLEKFRFELEDFRVLPEPKKLNALAGSGGDDYRMSTVNINKCAFLKHCWGNQEALPEPQWYAMISNLARVYPGGISLCHQMSKDHPKYSPTETNAKILHSLDSSGPITCKRIKELGFNGCPNDCRVKSPISLIADQSRRIEYDFRDPFDD